MKKLSILLIFIFFTMLSTLVLAIQQDLDIVRGEHWVSSSLEQKRAFLFGVGNVLEIEQAMAGSDYKSMSGRSIVPVLLEGLSGVSIADIVTQLDKFYANHPDQINESVIKVLFIEMALPNMKK